MEEGTRGGSLKVIRGSKSLLKNAVKFSEFSSVSLRRLYNIEKIGNWIFFCQNISCCKLANDAENVLFENLCLTVPIILHQVLKKVTKIPSNGIPVSMTAHAYLNWVQKVHKSGYQILNLPAVS